MTGLNEWGVDPSRVVPGVRIRLTRADDWASGVVVRMDLPRMGVVELSDRLGNPTGERAIFHTHNVTGAGLVCREAGALPAPCWRADFIDFPTGWHIQRQGVIHVDHRCSAVQAWGAFLCDCGAIETEWKRRRALVGQRTSRGDRTL